MELYHANMSVCSQKVRLVLHEKGLKPVEHHLDLAAAEQTRPEYLKLNPNGVVPTLVEDGQPIIESSVICEYLEDVYPEPPLRPKDTIKRATMRVWKMIPDTGLHNACATTSFAVAFRHRYLQLAPEGLERQLAEKPDPAVRERLRDAIVRGLDASLVPQALKLYDSVLTKMAGQLDKTPWLVGNEYSLADVALLPYVVRLEHLSLGWLWEGKRASIGRWLERCKSRRNYSAIANYLVPAYLELMEKVGREARPKVEAILR